MKILLAGATFANEHAIIDAESYLNRGVEVDINVFDWLPDDQQTLRDRYRDNARLGVVDFDYSDPEEFAKFLRDRDVPYTAVVCPPHVYGFTEVVLNSLLASPNGESLRAVGVPNDSVVHVKSIVDIAAAHGIAVVHVPGAHAGAVAEFTMAQIGFHARRFDEFYAETGRRGVWPHDKALTSTSSLQGKWLGIIGGSGRDGSAVAKLARKMGLNVISIGSGSTRGVRRILASGAVVAASLKQLIERSDFISVNCRPTPEAIGLISAERIGWMKPGTIVISASAAEVFDKQAVIDEFNRPEDQRRIRVLVLDMPFGGRRDPAAFSKDPDNAELKKQGVLFTPRMAGYTVETSREASTRLADYLIRYLNDGDPSVPIHRSPDTITASGGESHEPDLDQLLADMTYAAKQAGAEAMRIRNAGLQIEYKVDGSPATNADIASEELIREHLQSCGYNFPLLGEEVTDLSDGDNDYVIIADGIDGTRNFRDGNYGWCVSIAFVRRSVTLVAVVYEPQSGELYYAVRGRGAFRQVGDITVKCTVSDLLPHDFSFSVGSFHMQGSRAKKVRIIDGIKSIGGREREWGCVALSICAVARGGLGVFIQGNSHLHDHAAALLIAEESGVEVICDPHGPSAVTDIIVAHPSLRERIVGIVETAVSEAP